MGVSNALTVAFRSGNEGDMAICQFGGAPGAFDFNGTRFDCFPSGHFVQIPSNCFLAQDTDDNWAVGGSKRIGGPLHIAGEVNEKTCLYPGFQIFAGLSASGSRPE